MNVSELSTKDLEAELAKRKEKIKYDPSALREGWPTSPVGTWKVTTEGDCEGRSTTQLGTFDGHVMDIAASLSDKVFYSLTFKPCESVNILPNIPEKREKVWIQLDISSGTWDMGSEKRDQVTYNWLMKDKNETVDYEIADRDVNYYGASYFKFTKKDG